MFHIILSIYHIKLFLLQTPFTMGGINRQHSDNGAPGNIFEITSYWWGGTGGRSREVEDIEVGIGVPLRKYQVYLWLRKITFFRKDNSYYP